MFLLNTRQPLAASGTQPLPLAVAKSDWLALNVAGRRFVSVRFQVVVVLKGRPRYEHGLFIWVCEIFGLACTLKGKYVAFCLVLLDSSRWFSTATDINFVELFIF